METMYNSSSHLIDKVITLAIIHQPRYIVMQ